MQEYRRENGIIVEIKTFPCFKPRLQGLEEQMEGDFICWAKQYTHMTLLSSTCWHCETDTGEENLTPGTR